MNDIKAEGQKITYEDLCTIPQLREMINGELCSALPTLKVYLYNVGFERFLDSLSPAEKALLKDLLDKA